MLIKGTDVQPKGPLNIDTVVRLPSHVRLGGKNFNHQCYRCYACGQDKPVQQQYQVPRQYQQRAPTYPRPRRERQIWRRAVPSREIAELPPKHVEIDVSSRRPRRTVHQKSLVLSHHRLREALR